MVYLILTYFMFANVTHVSNIDISFTYNASANDTQTNYLFDYNILGVSTKARHDRICYNCYNTPTIPTTTTALPTVERRTALRSSTPTSDPYDDSHNYQRMRTLPADETPTAAYM